MEAVRFGDRALPMEMENHGVIPRVRDLISRARFVRERIGWAHVPLWLCSTLGRRVSFHILVVWSHPVDGPAPEITDTVAELEARFLTPDEIIRFASPTGSEYRYSPVFASDALSRGHRCFGLFDRGRLISYCWYAQGPAQVFDGIDVAVEFPNIYGFNAYTDSSHRGRGLHVFGVKAASQVLKLEGFRDVMAYIEADNLAPLVAARKMGERIRGYVFLWRPFRRFHAFATPGCRAAGFRVC